MKKGFTLAEVLAGRSNKNRKELINLSTHPLIYL